MHEGSTIVTHTSLASQVGTFPSYSNLRRLNLFYDTIDKESSGLCLNTPSHGGNSLSPKSAHSIREQLCLQWSSSNMQLSIASPSLSTLSPGSASPPLNRMSLITHLILLELACKVKTVSFLKRSRYSCQIRILHFAVSYLKVSYYLFGC